MDTVDEAAPGDLTERICYAYAANHLPDSWPFQGDNSEAITLMGKLPVRVIQKAREALALNFAPTAVSANPA